MMEAMDLPGAQVRVAGVTSTTGATGGTVTDVDGFFSLTVRDNTTNVVVEASGFRTQNVASRPG